MIATSACTRSAPLPLTKAKTTQRGSALRVQAFRYGTEEPTRTGRELKNDAKANGAELKAQARDTVYNINSRISEYAERITEKWDESEKKPQIILTGAGMLVALYIISGVVDRVNKLPLLPGLFELVGLTYTGWVAYRWFLFPEERETIKGNVKKLARDVGIDL